MFCTTLSNCLNVLLDPEKIRNLEPSFVIDMRTFPNFATISANIVESGKMKTSFPICYNCNIIFIISMLIYIIS